jgi:hypothetical protein
LITAAAGISAIVLLATYLTKIVHWVDKTKQAETDIKELRHDTEDSMTDFRAEQAIIVMGILAALKGLKEQGCNGPVTEAIDKIEAHINRKAHE